MTVESLETTKLKRHRERMATILNRLESEGRLLYETAIQNGLVNDDTYDANVWPTPKSQLKFAQAIGTDGKLFPKHAIHLQPYKDPRCVRFIKAYTATKLDKSESQRRMHNQAAKLLLHFVDNEFESLCTLTQHNVETFIRTYQKSGGGSASGIENRLAGPKGLIAWMKSNGLLLTPFNYSCVLIDKHKLAKHDITSPQAAEKVNNKRPPSDLDTVLGEVILKTENGNNEPKPGYFRLRALMITFMMAAGLRIGEALTLEVDCFDEIDGKTWLKVLSEKAGVPRLIPLGAGWDALLKKRHEEVLELTAAARKVAMAFEDGSFFVDKRNELEELAKSRKTSKRYRNHQHLLVPSSGFFMWTEYHAAGLLPRYSEKTRKHDSLLAKGEQVLKSSESLWIPFDAYESWTLDLWCMMLSNHFGTAVKVTERDNPKLIRAGYRISHPLSEHLFVKFRNHFHKGRPNDESWPEPVAEQHINRFLRSTHSSTSVFEELNIRDRNGKIFELKDRVTSQVFRHWKEDARFRAGGNELAIALLSGRTPGQNRAYDKRTASELAEQHKELYTLTEVSDLPNDPLGKRVAQMLKVGKTEQEIQGVIEETLQIMHLTPWGGCSRDLDREPCPKHYKCLRGFSEQQENDNACANFHIDPSDPVAKENIEHTLRVARYQFESLKRLTSPEMIEDTLAELELGWNPERGHSLLAMQVKHQLEIIKGCEAALRTYESRSAGIHEDRYGRELRQVASVNHIRPVNLFDPRDAK